MSERANFVLPGISQIAKFAAAGAVQYLLDLIVFALMYVMTGDLVIGNMCGRLSGTVVGFFINRRFTFQAAEGPLLHGGTVLRYCTTWLGATALSTACLKGIELWLSAENYLVMLFAKGVVEIGMFFVGFFALKRWVFRETRMPIP